MAFTQAYTGISFETNAISRKISRNLLRTYGRPVTNASQNPV